jgi:sialic acid synthase
MVRDIRVAERWMGREDLYIEESVASAKNKLERSIATVRKLKVGEVINELDLHLLSPGDGFKWTELDKVVGKTIVKEIGANELIYPDCIQ